MARQVSNPPLITDSCQGALIIAIDGGLNTLLLGLQIVLIGV